MVEKAIGIGIKFTNFVTNIPLLLTIRAAERLTDRMGKPVWCGYHLPFLSLIPVQCSLLVQVLFSFKSDLLATITGVVLMINLSSTVQQSIDTAVRQRTTGRFNRLAIALYSGVNWVGNLRQAILLSLALIWERNKEIKKNLLSLFSRF